MSLYQYVKAPPGNIGKSRRRPYLASFLLMTVGIGLLFWTGWPIISYALVTVPALSTVASPVSSGSVLAPVVLAAGKDGAADYTDPNIWFPTAPQKKVITPVNAYTLSIPKLRIANATVIVAGDDLNKSLIHYGGTGLPGEYGTTVIFGHSVLPQFFDPTNYKTIFSTLPTIKIGDDIFVTYDGVSYRYVVYDMVVTEPNDLSALEQKFDDSYITLITCVPPGTYWKRLNVKARLVKLPSGT